ncbi:organic cation transporter-like protein isoform X2 [Eriocheir sinensis]|uniref:organic cation transporter-like protein isoform X2 n=1 Tax=Eriocheir sinensis TaxID=95602 RepID=UPI0021C5968B|nr:organic cation transporter-like protein isoform X2 [Eriocheir sinensis]
MRTRPRPPQPDRLQFEWVCERDHLRATYQGVYMLSTAITPLLSGYLADRFGRMKVLVASHVALSVTSISLSFVHSVPLIFLLRFFTGSSEIMTGLVLTLEVCEPRHRVAVGVLTGIAWSAGTMLWGTLAYFIRGWRHLQLAASLPTLLAFPILLFMDESPRWLIVRGRFEKAKRVLEKAARWNKKTLPPEDQLDNLFSRIYSEETEEMKKESPHTPPPEDADVVAHKRCCRRHRLCWNKNIALVTIINCMIYFCVALVFDGLNLAGDLYSDDPFLYLILGGLVEVPGILFAAPLIHHLGRKGPLVACLFGSGVVNVALSVLPAAHVTTSLVLAMMGKLLVCAAFQILYVYSNELFPTEVRVSGVEGASAVGQVGALMAPYFSTYLGPLVSWLPSAVYGGLSIASSCATLLLRETKDKPLPDTIADLDAAVRKRNLRTEIGDINSVEGRYKISEMATLREWGVRSVEA